VGDLNDQEFIDEAMIGVDTVVHIAGIPETQNVIQAAVKYDVKRVILIHTTGIYSKYKSAAEAYKNIETKMRAIIEANGSSVGVIVLRPTMIYGNVNDQNMIKFIKLVDKFRLFPVINHGRGYIQPVNARDLGKAYYQALATPNITSGDYILSGDAPITTLDVLRLISNNFRQKTTFMSCPLDLGVFMGRMLKAVTLGRVDYIGKLQRMGEGRSFPHDDATRDFGYSPMPFKDGLQTEAEQYLNLKRK